MSSSCDLAVVGGGIAGLSAGLAGARLGRKTLVLTKGLGVGIFSAALRQDRLSSAAYQVMIASTTRLNSIGAMLPEIGGVHAVTDVTGFGLLGHLLEMCQGSGVAAHVRLDDVPMLAGAAALAREGIGTGAATRNWQSYGGAVRLPQGLAEWRRGVLCDPQTSGGLLIAVAEEDVATLLERLREAGFADAAVIGNMQAGTAGFAPDITVSVAA